MGREEREEILTFTNFGFRNAKLALKGLIKIRICDIINMFHKYRSSCPKVFCKNAAFNHKIHNKVSVLESRFEKKAQHMLIKKRLRHRCFPVSF